MLRHVRLAVLSVLFLQLVASGEATLWPLERYEPDCGSLQISGAHMSRGGAGDGVVGMSLDSDSDILWTVEGATLTERRYSTGEILKSLDLSSRGTYLSSAQFIESLTDKITTHSIDTTYHDELNCRFAVIVNCREYQSQRNLLANTARYGLTWTAEYYAGSILPSPRKLRRNDHDEDAHSPSLGVAALPGGQAAVTNRQDAGILIYGTNPETGGLALQKWISTSIVVYSLTYDAAYGVFYATPLDNRQSVIQLGNNVISRPMFGDDTQVALLLGDDPITDIHYSANTGTIFVLCAGCNTILEVTLSGNVRSSNERDLRSIGAPVVGLSFGRIGSPMLLMTEGLQVLALCQDIEPGLPVLPPELIYSPQPQTWFSLDTYLFCGAWQFDEVTGATLADMAIDPTTRTVWGLVDGGLVEYDLRGAVLRRQSREDLAALGLRGVSSVAWMGRGKLLLGLREGNVVAVVDTVPPEVVSRITGLVARTEAQRWGVETIDEETMEPAGVDAEEEAVRLANRLAVDSKATIGGNLLPPNSLGAITYDSDKRRIIAASTSRLGLIWSSLNGQESGEMLSVGEAETANVTSIDSLVYDPITGEFLLWCESCAQLREVSAGHAGVSPQKTFPLLRGDSVDDTAASFSMTPEGSMLLLGGNAGEVTFYCSAGGLEGEDGVIQAVREKQDAGIDPSYFWKAQRLAAAASPARNPYLDNDATRSDAVYGYSEKTGCKDATLGAKVTGTTVPECQALCTANLACNAFTVNTAHSICYLKATCEDAQSSDDDYTGRKAVPTGAAPVPTNQVVVFSYADNLGCTDPSLSILRDIQRDVCESACTLDNRCNAYTFNADRASCYLKSSCDEWRPLDSDFSGFKLDSTTYDVPASTKPTTSPTKFSTLEGVVCGQADIAIIRSATRVECEQTCGRVTACHAFTFFVSKHVCHLKPDCGQRLTQTDAISGIKVEVAINSPQFVLLADVGCKDPTLAVFRDVSRQQCESECVSNSRCLAYTHNTAQSCFLKRTCNAQEPQIDDTSGVMTTGDVPSQIPTPAPTTSVVVTTPSTPTTMPSPPVPTPANGPLVSYFQIQTGTGCTDKSLKIHRDISREQCEAECSVRPVCKAYTHNRVNDCFLKRTCDQPRLTEGDVTGILVTASVPTATLPPSAATYDVTAGVGCIDDTMARFEDSSVEGCGAACEAELMCAAFTFNTETRRCFLKETCNSTKWADSDVSGAKLSFEYLYATGCDDGSIGVTEGVTEAACEELCRGESECRYFTYNLEKLKCFLKPTCSKPKNNPNNITGAKLGPLQIVPPQDESSSETVAGGELVGGWEWLEGQDCTPWEGKVCGLGSGPGLKVGDITWYRMFAHRANPLRDNGDGVLEWTPYRVRREWGAMYYKGSEIIGYFDNPMSIEDVGDEVEVTFLWSSEGESHPETCPGQTAREVDCNRCEEDYREKTGDKHIYHEVRCFSGTGDFRVALTDSTRAKRITNDGYGYWNEDVVQYRGLQWRFHPHACPQVPREKPGGFDATAAASWIRSNIDPSKPNSQGLVLDFVENAENGRRSFRDRLFDPQDDGACLNLPNGEWTPEDKPFKMRLQYKSRSDGKVRFDWRMEFNGWVGGQTEEWDEDMFPKIIDSIVIGIPAKVLVPGLGSISSREYYESRRLAETL